MNSTGEDTTIMPFGKHRGRPLSAVPLGYLGWLMEEGDLMPDFRAVIRTEIQRRIGSIPDTVKIYRTLAMKYHPDHGGSNEAFRAIKDFHDAITRYE